VDRGRVGEGGNQDVKLPSYETHRAVSYGRFCRRLKRGAEPRRKLKSSPTSVPAPAPVPSGRPSRTNFIGVYRWRKAFE